MSKIRSKNTKPELILKKNLIGLYLRYQPKSIIGNPDFANKTRKIAIFLDGCFWHKCPKCFRPPKSNKRYWIPKIRRNVQRADDVAKKLKNNGWKVVRIWEHELTKNQKRITRIKQRLSIAQK